MKIFFNEVQLKAIQYKKEIEKKVSEIVDSGIFLHGKENETLVKNLNKYLGKGNAVITHSGTDALHLAIKSLKLSDKDEVIFPVNTYPTAFPLAISKVKLVPVDVDENGLINPKEITKKLAKKTKAIIVVHLYGLVVNLDEIKKTIKNRGIFLIEDCAQAFGSLYKKKPVGTFADISCFSFYPTKNLATLGDGGAIWTNNKKLYNHFKKIISYGEKKRYFSQFIAEHSRLPEIQAGVLNIYFKNINIELESRKKVIKWYQELIKKYKVDKFLRILYHNKSSDPVVHLLVIEAKKRNQLKAFLNSKKIPTGIHYPRSIHLLPAFSYLGYKKGDFPMAEHLSEKILSLPFHSYLTLAQIDYIVKSIRDFYE